MKCEIKLEQSDYIMAGKIMALVDMKSRITRSINCALALIFFVMGSILLISDYQNKIIIALVWGICSLFILLVITGFRRWNKKNTRNVTNVKPMLVTYIFNDSGLCCWAGNQRTDLPWAQLLKFGEHDGYFFMVFEKQQVVVLAKEKLSANQVEEMKKIMHIQQNLKKRINL